MRAAGGADVTATIPLTYGDDSFGGLSAIDLSQDGTRFLAVSDRAFVFQGELVRENGKLVGATILSGERLEDPQAKGRAPEDMDSEGLVLRQDGSFDVSFEFDTRILNFQAASTPGRARERAPWMPELGGNTGLEALALGPEGGLWTVPEEPSGGAFPIHRLHDGTWEKVGEIPASRGYRVTGLDFDLSEDGDGALYILERKLTFLGFQSRIRALKGEALRIVWTSGPGQFGNMEGIAVTRGASGETRLLIVSDDNFLWVLPTELVEITLPN